MDIDSTGLSSGDVLRVSVDSTIEIVEIVEVVKIVEVVDIHLSRGDTHRVRNELGLEEKDVSRRVVDLRNVYRENGTVTVHRSCSLPIS